MKLSEVYLAAAEIIVDGRYKYACDAIGGALGWWTARDRAGLDEYSAPRASPSSEFGGPKLPPWNRNANAPSRFSSPPQ